MKQSAPVSKLALRLSWLAAAILVLLPFHAFMTVWLSSLIGHYTLLRLWKEFLLVPITLGALYILFKDKLLCRRFFKLWLVRLILVYMLLMVICAFAGTAGPKAMWYGLLADLRFLVLFLAVLVLAARSEWLAAGWQKILLGPAIFVAAFAVLQYLVLPYDFLKHFGYGDSTISPYETINHNLQHIRVASTLRGANPLGAYLILPISALAAMYVSQIKQRRNIMVFGAGLLLALAFSFSRSAWIGAALAAASVIWLGIKARRTKLIAAWAAAGLVIIAVLLGVALRDNLSFENFIFHTDHASKIASTSDQGHSAAFKSAAGDIIHHPLGGGVGTAGPQSFYNDKPARIAENYYLQIGQEAGLVGTALFIVISIIIGKMLFDARAEPLALILLASLIGISFVNLLSHAWTDDTLAYIWWGLAAIAISPAILTDKHNQKNGKKIQTA